MKPQDQNAGRSILSFKKTTVIRLNREQISRINGGIDNQTTTGDNGDTGSGIPQTCGYACTDCMSTMPTRTITQIPTPSLVTN